MVWSREDIATSTTGVLEFDSFFRSTLERVVGSLMLVTRDPVAAEDAAQEAYARAYQRWDRVGSLERPDLWVLRVGTNIAINSWKKKRRENELPDETQGGRTSGSESLVQATWLQWGLDQLSPKQRAAFVMHYAEGWDISTVARKMGSSSTTVDTHLQRARTRLRDIFSAEQLQ